MFILRRNIFSRKMKAIIFFTWELISGPYCNFFGAALYITYGWAVCFCCSRVGMFIGVIIFITGTKHYKAYDIKKGVQQGDMSLTRIVMLILVPSIVAGVIGWLIPGNFFGSDSTDAFIFACIPVIYFYTSLYVSAEKSEKRPIAALLAIFAVVVLFWAVFKQNGSALNTWADRYTDREVTGTTEKVFEKLIFAQTLTYKKDSVAKYDDQFRIQKENGKVMKEFNYPVYFKNVTTEKLPAEDEKINIWVNQS